MPGRRESGGNQPSGDGVAESGRLGAILTEIDSVTVHFSARDALCVSAAAWTLGQPCTVVGCGPCASDRFGLGVVRKAWLVKAFLRRGAGLEEVHSVSGKYKDWHFDKANGYGCSRDDRMSRWIYRFSRCAWTQISLSLSCTID